MRRPSYLSLLMLVATVGVVNFAQISEAQSTQNPIPDPKTTVTVSAQSAPQRVKYFSLEHRTPDQMSEGDRDVLQSHKRELVEAAQIYGYDLQSGQWAYEQALCPEFSDTILLHYLAKFPDGTESLFTALIPENQGRIRIVPVLYRNASPYRPPVRNSANFALFNNLVSDDAAKKDSAPGGNWLSLGVCYAEMVGGRPNVPDQPDLDVATILAPVAAIRLNATTNESQIQFSDRDARKNYTIWTISFNNKGRVVAALNEDYATYVAHAVQVPEPVGKQLPALPEPGSKITPNPPAPPAKVTPLPPGM